MAYTPKTWTCGDTISAEDLNHIEQGIANSGGGTPLIVRFDHEDGNRIYYDKTWQEIHDAMPLVVFVSHEEGVEGGTTTITDTVDAVREVVKQEMRATDNVYFEYRVHASSIYYAESADGYIYSETMG